MVQMITCEIEATYQSSNIIWCTDNNLSNGWRTTITLTLLDARDSKLRLRNCFCSSVLKYCLLLNVVANFPQACEPTLWGIHMVAVFCLPCIYTTSDPKDIGLVVKTVDSGRKGSECLRHSARRCSTLDLMVSFEVVKPMKTRIYKIQEK